MSGWAVDTVWEKWIANLFLGGTSLFVFISGFLFHHIYVPRFNQRKFMAVKVKNVLVPYLLLSVPLILYSVLVKGTGPYAEYVFSGGAGFLQSRIVPIIIYVWTGRILEAYWYIPFIMVVFSLSPLVMAYVRLAPALRLVILFVLLAVSTLVQRPVLNLSVMQSVVYFLPVYLFGLIASIHRETIYARLKGREMYLLMVVALLALAQAYFYDFFGNFHKPPFKLAAPDILLAQKLVLCLYFMVLLHRYEHISIPTLDKLAAASFAIYFIHPYVLWGVQLVLNRKHPLLESIHGPVLWLVMTMAVVLVSMAIAMVVRRLGGPYSRMIIGW